MRSNTALPAAISRFIELSAYCSTAVRVPTSEITVAKANIAAKNNVIFTERRDSVLSNTRRTAKGNFSLKDEVPASGCAKHFQRSTAR